MPKPSDVQYIEDFFVGGPDFANGYAAGGDSNDDWIPAFYRATTRHIDRRSSDRTMSYYAQAPTYIGKEQTTYEMGSTLHLFGAHIVGLRNNVTLKWTDALRGIHIHHGASTELSGTSFFHCDGIWADFKNCGGNAHLSNFIVDMNNYSGSVGIVVQSTSILEDLYVNNCGWHSIYITAGATRSGSIATDEYPGRSIASNTTLRNINCIYPGTAPGTSSYWETVANPDGWRPAGCGLRVEGPDANNTIVDRIIVTGKTVAAGGRMGWAIDDNSSLGGLYSHATAISCERAVTQYEHDIIAATDGTPTAAEIEEFAHPLLKVSTDSHSGPADGWNNSNAATRVSASYGVDETMNLAFRSRADGVSVFVHEYIEPSTPVALCDIQSPSFLVNRPNSMGECTWNILNSDGDDYTAEMTLATSGGSYISMDSDDWTNPLALKPHSEYLRADIGDADANVPFYITAGAPTVDGVTLTNGRLIVADYYRNSAFPGGAVSYALPRHLDTVALLPDLATGSVATANPIGSIQEIADPIEGGSVIYACVAAASTVNGTRWLPIGRLAPLNRGFYDRTQSTISFVSGTRELSLANVASGTSFVANGVAYRKTTTQTYALPDTEGMHYCHFNASGTLSGTQTFSTDIITNLAPVSFIYWDATNDYGILIADERHTQALDASTHLYLHSTQGAQLNRISTTGDSPFGLVPGTGAPDGNGSLDSHAQFSLYSGSIFDEDIHFGSSDTAQQLTPIAQIPILYRTGAAGEWRTKIADDFALIQSGAIGPTTGGGRASIYDPANARIAYNQYTGGAWKLTEAGANDYVLTHIFATNDIRHSVMGILGQALYTSKASARTGAEEELRTLSISSMPGPEFVWLYSIIFETHAAYTNSVNARILSTVDGDPAEDWRNQCFSRTI